MAWSTCSEAFAREEQGMVRPGETVTASDRGALGPVLALPTAALSAPKNEPAAEAVVVEEMR